MTTRCKFACTAVKKMRHWNKVPDTFLYQAEFTVVTADNPENKSFFDATPTGTLTIGTYRDDRFEPGKEYYIDIIEVPK